MRQFTHRFVASVVSVFLLGAWVSPAPAFAGLNEPTFQFEAPEFDFSTDKAEWVFQPPSMADPLARNPQLAFSQSQRKIAAKKTQPRKPVEHKLNWDYFKGIFSDTKYILQSPVRWDGGDWFKASLVAGATGLIFVFDDDIRDFMQDARNDTTDTLADVFEPFGNGAFVVPALAVFYGIGHFNDHERTRRVALLGIESYLVSGAFVLALKTVTGRHRPNKGNGSREWDAFEFNSNHSFPSGHTATAFSLATVLASEYKEYPLVAYLSYGVATLTGLSRMNDDKHFASDVFLGAAIGYFTAKTIMKLHSNKNGLHYTIYPRLSGRETSLVLALRF